VIYPFVQAYHDLGKARGPRLAMVWHMAEGGGTVGFLSRRNAHGVSVHFVVEYSGRIVQMLRLDHMHSSIRTSDIRITDDPAGVGYGRSHALAVLGDWADIVHGTSGPNHATIAVEVEGFAADGPLPAQALAIGRLAVDLKLPAHLGHRDFADYKQCPGQLFPWSVVGGHGAPEDEPMIPVAPGGPWDVKLVKGDQLFDQSFAPLVKVSVGQTARGLFRTGTGFYGIDITTGGERQLAFIRDTAPVTPVAADCGPIQRQLDVANGRIRAGITALGGTQP
jgi:hypothetical protein